MRILHIIATLAPQAGGPSNSVRRILTAYPGIGSGGEVVTLDDPDEQFLRDISFPVHALGPVSTRFGFSRRLIPWLIANRDRFDGVVVHGLWQYLGYAVRRAINGRKPYLVFTHGMLDPYFRRAHPFKHIKKTLYWLLNEYWVLRNAHRVLFTSEGEAVNAAKSFWPHRWRASVVPYGATAPSGDPAVLVESFLREHPELRKPDGRPRPYLLFLGRIHAKKGCDHLLEAFAKIASRVPDLQLVFAGPDGAAATGLSKASASNMGTSGLKSALVAEAKRLGLAHRVHWTGMLEGDQKWGAFHGCEAFCLPSHQENFGIAVAEALACGKPVLISDKVDIWKEILHDRAAFVGHDNVAGAVSTLESWISLPASERAAMGARALQCFRSRYDMQANASGIVEAFNQAIATKSGKRAVRAEAKLPAL
ncbi:glycosyltransferase involved in cell wall biosynthesis [Granulicella aggregans]|uniref:Glycosyltransferase involved in cell wall biosynthesis n=1 Tax=Granulicella aggregans TaxID=474949 RepID=A0A7W7ZFU6_9BACT|nr:glycosyltransferase [Granulicella aggregans]MBB5059031.1 glycosyltransferase involved in cell wall biosynthesis [Granulicella aggregans]